MKLPEPHSDTQHTLLTLITCKSVTSIELRDITKSSYPPARIKDLRNMGIDIGSTDEMYVNRRGQICYISRYKLETPMHEAKKIYKQLVGR